MAAQPHETSPAGLPTVPPTVGWPGRERRTLVDTVMGIPVSIQVRQTQGSRLDLDSAPVTVAVGEAFGQLHRFDAIFSTHRADSDISRMRASLATIEECDPLVAEALAIGIEAGRQTRGAFTTLLPDGEGELAFDPTGLVKGWALDVAAEVLEERLTVIGGERISFCLNAGGDIVVGHGGAVTDAPVWRVGVENPHDVQQGHAAASRDQIAAIVPLRQGALATSGRRARGDHLLDGTTRRPVRRDGSVTVVGTNLLWADIWATALFVGGDATRAAFDALGPEWTCIEL